MNVKQKFQFSLFVFLFLDKRRRLKQVGPAVQVQLTRHCRILLFHHLAPNLPKRLHKNGSVLSYRITFPEESADDIEKNVDEKPKEDSLPEILIESFVIPNRGPYPYNQPKR